MSMTENAANAGRRGIFLTFEGTDGCGKTTQMRLLAERLRREGYDVLETTEPGGTRIGVEIRRILLDPANQELSPTTELLLYFASRAQAVDQWIRPALAEGRIVVSDRFTDSTMAYQGYGRGLGRETVLAVDRVACRGLAPDLTLVIDIDLETSLARMRARNHERRNQTQAPETRMDDQAVEFHRRVREAYLEMVRLEPGRFRLIDGRSSAEAVARLVWDAVKPLLGTPHV